MVSFSPEEDNPQLTAVFNNSNVLLSPVVWIVVLVSGVVCLGLGYYLAPTKLPTIDPSAIIDNSNVEAINRPILRQITAQISGQITAIQGNQITIKDPSGIIDQFNLTPGATFSQGIKATTLSDASSLPLNKDLIFTLVLNQNKFFVSAIFEVPTAPPAEVNLIHKPDGPLEESQTNKLINQ